MRAIVVGAGFAGLAAALRLVRAGLEVTLIDQLSGPGGKAIGWEGLPTGPTLLTLGPWIQGLFQEAGLEPPPLTRLEVSCTYRFADGLEFAPGPPGAEDVLPRGEREAYVKLLARARELYEGVEATFLAGPPPRVDQLIAYGLRSGWKAAPTQSLARLVARGPHLEPFFLRFATYVGANPYRAPAVLHNIAWVELGLGAYHLPGGAQALAERLAQGAQRQGVRIVYGERIEKAEYEGQELKALRGSERWEGELFVLAVDRHFARAWFGLAPPRYPLGISALALLLHLKAPQPLAHRVWFPKHYRQEWDEIEQGRLPQMPTLYLYTEGEAGFLLINAPNLSQGRPEVHAAAEAYLQQLQRLDPLEVAEVRVLGPQDYALTSFQGALYGKAPHGLWGALRPGWQVGRLRNAIQVGGTVHPGGGVPLALRSGWLGAEQLLLRLSG